MYLAPDLKTYILKSSLKFLLFFVIVSLSFISCEKDKGTDTSEPPRDMTQQYIAENDSIIEFMQTHFYNYEDFINLNATDSPEIVFDTIAGDNVDKIPIYNQVSTIEIDVKDENDNIVKHNLYYHVIREGVGDTEQFLKEKI